MCNKKKKRKRALIRSNNRSCLRYEFLLSEGTNASKSKSKEEDMCVGGVFRQGG